MKGAGDLGSSFAASGDIRQGLIGLIAVVSRALSSKPLAWLQGVRLAEFLIRSSLRFKISAPVAKSCCIAFGFAAHKRSASASALSLGLGHERLCACCIGVGKIRFQLRQLS